MPNDTDRCRRRELTALQAALLKFGSAIEVARSDRRSFDTFWDIVLIRTATEHARRLDRPT
jgi:hypothetical protein